MNELTDKIITFGRNYKSIVATKIFEVSNDNDSYLLIYTKDDYTHKIYMEFEEIDKFFEKNKNKKEINMKDFLNKTYIIKDNKEILATK